MTGRALTRKERQQRDALILDLFVAGHSQKTIGANAQVNLTDARVNQIIKAELERCAADHILRNANAMTIYMARMEHLVKKAMSHVDNNDLKAIEVARPLMTDQAKIYDMVDERLSAGPTPPMSDAELDDGDVLDELSAYRAQRKQVNGET